MKIDLARLPVEITYQIVLFRDFLVASWPFLDKVMADHNWDEDGSFSDDWIQANWEFIVERELLENKGRLRTLGWNKHITRTDSMPDYKVTCHVDNRIVLTDWIKKATNYQQEELLLFGFCTWCGETFGLYPPFDYVQIRTEDKKKLYIVPLDSCKFLIKRNDT